MLELRITRRAQEDLRALPPGLQEAVLETLALLAIDPQRRGKPLVGRLEGLWSARVGNYRVLSTFNQRETMIRAIRHRSVVYRGRRRP